jgi:hypothetical protein
MLTLFERRIVSFSLITFLGAEYKEVAEEDFLLTQ